jgi:hypothetical protein
VRARREWLVLGGVLVPFAVLVALGLQATAGDEAPVAGAHAVNTPPPEEDAGREPVLDAGQALALAVEDAGPAEVTPPGLEAALSALRPALAQCLTDAREHAPPRVELRVRFRAHRDGRFSEARLEAKSWQDPYVEACIADVFDEVRYAPSGREPDEVVEHTFVVAPEGLRRTR